MFGSLLRSLGKGYCYIARFFNYLQSPLLLLIRLYWGYLFMMAGWGKFHHIQETAAFFDSLQFSYPYFFAYLVATTEFLGGIMLIVGFWSRLAALALTITMSVAYYTAHAEVFQNFWQDPSRFTAEAPFLFLFASLIILAFGAGWFSFDGLCRSNKHS